MIERDDQGRPSRWITTRESEWDDLQRAEILALDLYRAGLCHRCNGELAETTDSAHDLDNPQGTHVYKRAKLVRCHRCTASMESDREHSSNPLVKHPGAVQHFVELVPRGRR